jgi:hypothetical protein
MSSVILMACFSALASISAVSFCSSLDASSSVVMAASIGGVKVRLRRRVVSSWLLLRLNARVLIWLA